MTAMEVLNSIFIIVILLIVSCRFLFNPLGTVMNFSFWPCIVGVFYILIPSVLIRYISMIWNQDFPSEIFLLTQIYSFFFCLILFIFYVITRDYKIEINRVDCNVKICWGLIFVIFSMTLFVFYKVLGDMLALTLMGDRGRSYDIFYKAVSGIPFNLMFVLMIVSSTIISLVCGKLWHWLFTLTVALFPLASGGRTFIFMFAIVFFIVYSLLYPKRVKVSAIFFVCIILFVILFWFLVKDIPLDDNLGINLAMLFADSTNSMLTVPVVLSNISLLDGGNTLDYILMPFLKLLNNSYFSLVDLDNPWIGDVISPYISQRTGFASNPITESLYYLGEYGPFISMFMVSLFFFILHTSKIIKYGGGLLLFVVLVSFMRWFFRGTIYSGLTSVFYFFVLFLFIYNPFFKCKILNLNLKV